MEEEKRKEGVSVKELEGYAKKHRFELFYILMFILASLFTFVFWGATISIFLAGIGAIIGSLLPDKTREFSKKICAFVFKQEKTTQLVLGIVGLIIAVFVAPIVFFLIGLHGGKSMIHRCKEATHHE